jgi:hypothetical protein
MDRFASTRAARRSAVLLVIALALTGCSTTSGAPDEPSLETSSASATSVASETAKPSLSYKGEDGVDALTLLKTATNDNFDAKGSGSNAFVTSINGVAADDSKHEYWAFYVNGKLAQVGAGSYTTKDGDDIQWKLETY